MEFCQKKDSLNTKSVFLPNFAIFEASAFQKKLITSKIFSLKDRRVLIGIFFGKAVFRYTLKERTANCNIENIVSHTMKK